MIHHSCVYQCVSTLFILCLFFLLGSNLQEVQSYSPMSINAISTTTTSTTKPTATNSVLPPPISRATQLPNEVYTWRNQQIRYQVAKPKDGSPSKGTVVLIHGLFVNCDHWRHTLKGLAEAGYTGYALDMIGYGYSSKPSPTCQSTRQLVCGESNGRFRGSSSRSSSSTTSSIIEEVIADDDNNNIDNNNDNNNNDDDDDDDTVKKNVMLGTANGKVRMASEVDLKHPCQSLYNFYTWSEQICDFVTDIVLPNVREASSTISTTTTTPTIDSDGGNDSDSNSSSTTTATTTPTPRRDESITLVCNSIGTISSFQSVLDRPDLFNGVFVVNPNFRELHSAEIPLSTFSMPIVRKVQSFLRNKGQSLFDTLANPQTVKQILQEPYAITDAVDDELVDVLLTPLLLPGASDVVFDALSYSAGPLPEQQLREESFPNDNVPVWVCYGSKDPWTPSKRVEKMIDLESVEKVIRLDGIGHCPHDEAPELVNPLLVQFLERIKVLQGTQRNPQTQVARYTRPFS